MLPNLPFIKVWLVLLQSLTVRLYHIHRRTSDGYQCQTQPILYAPDGSTSGFGHLLWPVHTIPVPLDWPRKMERSQKCHLEPVGPNTQGHPISHCTRIPISLCNLTHSLSGFACGCFSDFPINKRLPKWLVRCTE